MKRTVERLAERGVVGVPPLAEYKDTNSHRADLAIVDGILPTTGRAGGEPLTMSSREIAQLLGARHDNVKRTINTLANRSAISHPQTEGRVFVDALGQRRSEVVCLLNKRSSLIVVAQLSRVEGALLGISEALRAADPAVPTLLRIVSTGAYATLEASEWKPTANAPIGLLEARAALLEAVSAFSDLRVELLSQQDETLAPLMQAAKEEAEIAAAERIAAIGLAA